jgi:TolA-binding protein
MQSDISQSGQLYAVLGWLEKNRKQIISSAVILTVVGIIVAFVLWRNQQKEIAAGEAVSAMTLSATQGNVKAADWLKVAAETSGTGAGARALLTAAGDQFVDGKIADAQASFQKFLTEYDGSALTAQAKYGIAVCLLAQGKTNEALPAFKEIVDRFASANVVTPAKYSLAQLYQAGGKLEQARDLYMDLAHDPQNTYGSEAMNQLNELFKANPKLRPSPAAAAPVAPAITPAK